jgi:hypothetical protein
MITLVFSPTKVISFLASFGMTQLLVSSLELLSLMLDGLRLIILFIPNHLAIFAVHAVTL